MCKDYAFGELDDAGKSNFELFAALTEHPSSYSLNPMEGACTFLARLMRLDFGKLDECVSLPLVYCRSANVSAP